MDGSSFSYTKFMEAQVSNYKSIDPGQLVGESEAFKEFTNDFLKGDDLIRPFHEGLQTLLEKPCSGYSGDLSDNKAKADFIFQQMQALPSNITKATIKSWVDGTHTPSVTPGKRQRIFELCFALHLSYDDVVKFFHHVYLDRSFNCHTIKEAVYYYCFQHQLPYSTALALIQKVQDAPEPDTPAETIGNYTKFVREQLNSFQTEEELLHYLISNKHSFRQWNQTALSYIQTYLFKIKGSAQDKESKDSARKKLERLKRNLLYYAEKHADNNDDKKKSLGDIRKEIKGYGLLLQEIFEDALVDGAESTVVKRFLERLKNKDVFSDDFLLDRILGREKLVIELDEEASKGIIKENRIQMIKDLPESLRRNFPSKMTLSAVLNMEKSLVSEGYDSIRKVLILLAFYTFWCSIKVNPKDYKEHPQEELTNIFFEQTNKLLFDCGYENLYAGNPYDLLFLVASHNEKSPLDFFHRTIDSLLNLTDEEE